ncbi:MAG: hypothetical protein AABY22_24300 [Nanoarchaeota archaeon]
MTAQDNKNQRKQYNWKFCKCGCHQLKILHWVVQGIKKHECCPKNYGKG